MLALFQTIGMPTTRKCYEEKAAIKSEAAVEQENAENSGMYWQSDEGDDEMQEEDEKEEEEGQEAEMKTPETEMNEEKTTVKNLQRVRQRRRGKMPIPSVLVVAVMSQRFQCVFAAWSFETVW